MRCPRRSVQAPTGHVLLHRLCLVLLLAATLAALPILTSPDLQAQSFSLEQVLSAGFPTEVVVSSDGTRIAWLFDEEGRRNVWLATGPGTDWKQVIRLTAYQEDDGQELSGLRFTPDGTRLVYRRGSSRNQDGAFANPLSLPQGVTRDLWLVGVDGSEPIRLAGDVDPVMSPTDARLVWSSGETVWLLELDGPGGDVPPPRPFFQVRTGAEELRWSPDGTRLALSSNRDGRSILGLFDLRDGSLRWLTNGADRDFLPRWSPDGSRIAFIRQPAGWQGFAVCLVDAAGGGEKELWRSPDEEAGAYPGTIDGSYDLMYGENQLIFPGGWSGWNHLYALPEMGGVPRDLTPGEGIVENAVLSPQGDAVYVSTNISGIDHRQLARIRLRDGEIQWVERGAAIAWAPVPAARFGTGGRTPGLDLVAYIRSTATEPARVCLRDVTYPEGRVRTTALSEVRILSPLPDGFPRDRLVTPEAVVFPAPDGTPIHGQLFLPAQRRRRERQPAVIFMHGGSRRQMLLGWHNRGYYHNAYAFNQYLAACGYVVLSVNYRSGIGYGTAFREPPDYGWQGASEYQDIVAAGRWLQERPEVDPERIGLWGGSYGGYLTALGLARDSDLFKAGVDFHGVHDWSEQLAWWAGGQVPGPTEAARDSIARVAFQASPVAAIDSWRSPVLVIHADDDRNVPFGATIDLVARLRRKGDVPVHELYFPDDVHGFLLHRNWLEAYRTAADFLDRYLKEARGG